ncbi:MAG: ABC transporter permease [Treponema sp.]|jgi:ABC-type lipoprotein release transport system permease subunit|nr:ABC transporter permease [Treponema sp.]
MTMWRLIFRNIIRNRKNSLVIFILIVIITSVFFIGNSIIGQANVSLRKTYVDSLTADVVIQKNGDMSMNLFGPNLPELDAFISIPALPAYDHVMELVADVSGIEQYSPQISGRAAIKIPEISDNNELALICGIDPEKYFDCFPGILIEEGRQLQNGEYGAMITVERADKAERETGIRPAIGTPLLFTSAGDFSFRIREVPLTGIYRYENPGQFMSEIVLTDPQTARVLMAVQVATAPVEDSGDANLPDLGFGSNRRNIFDFGSGGIEEYFGETFDPDEFIDSIALSDTIDDTAGGDWNFILLRLKQGINPALFIKTLNKKLLPYNVYASGWRTAAGISAILLLLLQSFFNIGGFLVSIAGIIVVVNIVLISVFRRTKEIGTLRAIGASDKQIRFMIIGENCCIAFLAGLGGVLGGMLFLRTINSMGISIPNEFIAALLGSGILHIEFLPGTAIISFFIALFLGAAASVYPVETAVRIDPIVAVGQG